MTTAQKKKLSLEEFLGLPQQKQIQIPLSPEENQRLDVESRKASEKAPGEVKVKKKGSAILIDDSRPIEAFGEVRTQAAAPKEEAQAPRPLRERILPPPEEPVVAGPPPAMAPKFAPPAPAASPEIPEASGPSGWERFLVGATPALVGLLTGNELEGVSLSGQTLANTEADLYKRQNDFNAKLAEMKAKRALSGSTSKRPNFARQEIYDPNTGKTYIHSLVDNNDMGVLGEAPPNKVRESYTKTELYNPETKQMEIAFVDPKTKRVDFYGPGPAKANRNVLTELDFQGENTKAVVNLDEGKVVNYVGKTPEKKSPYASLEEGRNDRFRQQKMQDFAGKLTSKGSVFNDKKANTDGIVKAAAMLNSGVPIANAGLRNYIARNIFGEKGPLSDGDVTRLEGDPSLMERVSRFYEKWSTGNITEVDREDMRAVIEIAHKLESQDAMGEASRVGRAFSASGIDMTPIVQAYTSDAIKPLPKFVRGKGTTALKNTFSSDGPKVGEIRKGYKFKGGDPTKSESWEKQ